MGFLVNIAGGITKVSGSFNKFDLKLRCSDKGWAHSNIDFTINASSVDTGIKDRDDHLRTADFFYVEKYPQITFVSEKIREVGPQKFVAEGWFSMHGISQNMSLPIEVTSEDGNTLGIKIEHSVNRIDYGVGKNFNHTSIPDFISDDIDVRFYF